MHRNTDDIQIQGPPIDEIQKRSSCLKRSCGTLLGIIIVLLLILSFLIHTIVRPRIKHLAILPTDIPKEIPIYDAQNLDVISYIDGGQRAQAIELLAFVPKAILSPLILAIENADEAAGAETESLWESFIRILGTPVADHRNILSVEWTELQAAPSFIHSYYRTALTQAGYTETDEHTADSTRFENEREGTTVTVDIQDNGNAQDGTDYAILRVYYTFSPKK
ncbi:MAG: hypothetical protein UV82_C0011G0056 [Candidatus Magasanikbacteria bacterium GW2011_GWD2_43_18]|nr:MAG: hypothetical protein UV18_C0007G0061 [Candidatus Magasanikbacteria bacterium GW2011_GWC2_42_27]KKT04128.1 MAG: hypothetical protein UV82_C0011G0056 [Candidatus Magasanikbacteria bacterium GW2011_GWD2_43_18]KKT25693.1 MAG: hypothetical protein UW10_C0005G0060 [Candidatus Magasanikbacteria bacterium GW2011_GWA2_43_9]HBB38514.1 hypothetical protein [Candidatus Magasanikbacteria bacterium]HCC13940.1 hypothetical protein [Candidatus Magasanikbacteria bacterium]